MTEISCIIICRTWLISKSMLSYSLRHWYICHRVFLNLIYFWQVIAFSIIYPTIGVLASSTTSNCNCSCLFCQVLHQLLLLPPYPTVGALAYSTISYSWFLLLLFVIIIASPTLVVCCFTTMSYICLCCFFNRCPIVVCSQVTYAMYCA